MKGDACPNGLQGAIFDAILQRLRAELVRCLVSAGGVRGSWARGPGLFDCRLAGLWSRWPVLAGVHLASGFMAAAISEAIPTSNVVFLLASSGTQPVTSPRLAAPTRSRAGERRSGARGPALFNHIPEAPLRGRAGLFYLARFSVFAGLS